MNIEAIMLSKRVDQAFSARRHALHKLRIGDRLGHRWGMQDALQHIAQARQWKPKAEIETLYYKVAAE